VGGVALPRGRTAFDGAVRARLGIVALLVVLAVVAWLVTVDRMQGMDEGPGSPLGGLGWFVGVWVVMMAAMMFPSVAPTVALYTRMTKRRGPTRPLLFAGAYLLLWGAAGVAAYGLWRAGVALLGDRLAWDAGGRWLAGAVVLGAALYELTPAKNICLSKCRTPLGFLLSAWRDGPFGALTLGARHAAWCVGCCWALMAALFALGVMSLLWMAIVGAMIALEKTLPYERAATWAVTALLLLLAACMFAAPDALPGLTVPGGHGAGGGMKMMM
jgi:predicted metal-binding membrane protein